MRTHSFSTYLSHQKLPPEVFYKKGALKNFAKLAGKNLCQSLSFNKRIYFIKKKTLAQVCKIFKNTFFTEHLRETISVTLLCTIKQFKHKFFSLLYLGPCQKVLSSMFGRVFNTLTINVLCRNQSISFHMRAFIRLVSIWEGHWPFKGLIHIW